MLKTFKSLKPASGWHNDTLQQTCQYSKTNILYFNLYAGCNSIKTFKTNQITTIDKALQLSI